MSNLSVNNITPLAGSTSKVSISGSLFVSSSQGVSPQIIGDSPLLTTHFSSSLSASVYSVHMSTSASIAAIKFNNLPTLEATARTIGTGSLWLSASADPGATNSSRLYVFTG